MNMISHYKLDDGRIWSVENAAFTAEVPDGAIVGPCPDEQGKSSLEGLVGCLKFYGYPMGALLPEEDAFAALRAERDARLAACDWTVLPDAPVTEEEQAAWKAYRQALRDLPQQEGAPWDGGGELTPWPVAPDAEATSDA